MSDILESISSILDKVDERFGGRSDVIFTFSDGTKMKKKASDRVLLGYRGSTKKMDASAAYELFDRGGSISMVNPDGEWEKVKVDIA